MPERVSRMLFPPWLIAIDLVAGVLVAAGLILRSDPSLLARFGLPVGLDLLLLGLGALGIAGCSIQIARIALASAASKSSR